MLLAESRLLCGCDLDRGSSEGEQAGAAVPLVGPALASAETRLIDYSAVSEGL